MNKTQLLILIFISSILSSSCATTIQVQKIQSNAYWQCQCWTDENTSSANMLLSFDSVRHKESLLQAQSHALNECRSTDTKVTVATCLKWVKADH